MLHATMLVTGKRGGRRARSHAPRGRTGDGDATPFTMFTLKEEPTPEPATLALLAAGALLLLRTVRRY